MFAVGFFREKTVYILENVGTKISYSHVLGMHVITFLKRNAMLLVQSVVLPYY
jgi:hypothetical protein